MRRREALQVLAGALGALGGGGLWPVTAVSGTHAVPRAYRHIGHMTRVPPRLLYAVALQESRLTLGEALTRPWPWTLNVAGTALRFRTRHAMRDALQAELEAEQRNVDIGLMQVNWGYHAHRFADIDDAVDPYRNIRVGALILREEYERRGDWWQAVGHYHSYRPRKADQYSRWVHRLWSALPDVSPG